LSYANDLFDVADLLARKRRHLIHAGIQSAIDESIAVSPDGAPAHRLQPVGVGEVFAVW
jgi:hypothetical protein